MPETSPVPREGTTIPDIPLSGAGGETRLRDEIAGAPAVLFFMRAADCPVCIAHARALGVLREAGDLGSARVLVIAPGGIDEVRLAARRIAAPSVEVRGSGTHHTDLGLGRFLMLQHSGTFVVDAAGSVLSAVTSALPTASFSKAKVVSALAGQQVAK